MGIMCIGTGRDVMAACGALEMRTEVVGLAGAMSPRREMADEEKATGQIGVSVSASPKRSSVVAGPTLMHQASRGGVFDSPPPHAIGGLPRRTRLTSFPAAGAFSPPIAQAFATPMQEQPIGAVGAVQASGGMQFGVVQPSASVQPSLGGVQSVGIGVHPSVSFSGVMRPLATSNISRMQTALQSLAGRHILSSKMFNRDTVRPT